MGFPDSSVGKESTCNARDPSLISGLERSPGEGIGYPLQYSWASLVAQLVKNLPAMQEIWVWETWVRSLGWEDPVFWPGEFQEITKSWTQLSTFHFHFQAFGKLRIISVVM